MSTTNDKSIENLDDSLYKPLTRKEQLALDLFHARRAYCLYWAQQKFKWTPKAFYQELLMGCFDRVYKYPLDHQIKSLRGKVVNRFAWRIGRQCIPQGTIIHTRDGKLVPIEEHPDAFPTQKNAKIYNIEIDGGYSIRCTGNHPISTRGKHLEFIEADQLKVGDEVEVLTEFDKWGSGKVAYSYESLMSKGRKRELVLPSGRADPNSAWTTWENKETKTGVYEINDELAELLGLFVADGNYNSQKTGSLQFTNSNEIYLKRFEELIAKYFPDCKTTRYQKPTILKEDGSDNRKLAFDIAVTAKGLGYAARGKNSFKHFLHAMNFHSCGFPRAVAEDFTRSQVIAFLRGAYASDGNFYVTKRHKDSFTYETTYAGSLNRTYTEYFKELFQKLGIQLRLRAQIGKKSTAPFYLLKGKNVNVLRQFIKVIGQIPVKEIPELALVGRYKPKLPLNSINAYKDGEKCGYAKIKKITIEDQLVDCFDVEIEDKGWFISSSVRVKNSGKSESLSLGVLYLAICKPIKYNLIYGVRRKSAISPENPTGSVRVVEEYVRGAKIIIASQDADKAKTVFDRVLKFLNSCPEYVLAMESGVIKVGKHPFPTIIINAEGWTEPAEIIFRGPGASGQAARSKTFDYKLYDEADYIPESFFEAELATEINAKTASGEDNSFVILSSTPSGRRAHFYKACFGQEALVTLADGSMKQIPNIKIGDLVLNRFGVPEPVTDVMQRIYRMKLIRLRIAGHEAVRITRNHKIMAVRRKHRLCFYCEKPVWANQTECIMHGEHHDYKELAPKYYEAWELAAGDYVAIPRVIADKFYFDDSYPKLAPSKGRVKFSQAYLDNFYKDENFLYIPIEEYEILPKGETVVYNLTVGDDHSYTVNGIGVSNCTEARMGFKEFHFPSWENPNYDERMDRKSQATLTKTAYQHEILAEWGTVESGVFDWTYFEKVFSYKYKNNSKLGVYEYSLIKLDEDKIRTIQTSRLAQFLSQRFVPRNPQCKYWFGADLGYSADPSEFVVFEEFNGVMKMVQRVHLEHVKYDVQADIIALMDRWFMFNMLGMDAGQNGMSLAQILQSKRTGWNKFAAHNFEKRLLPIPFGGRLQVDKINGKEITEPAKQAMTNMIIYAGEQKLLILPGLEYDPDTENQFRNHTYSVGQNGQIVYSKGTISADHIVDAVRCAMYAKHASQFVTKKSLPTGSMFKQPRRW